MDSGDNQLFIHRSGLTSYSYLQFTSTVIIAIMEWIFWTIILSITGLGSIYCCFKCSQKGKHWLDKWKTERNSATEDREFEKIRIGYIISTLELAGYGNDDENIRM